MLHLDHPVLIIQRCLHAKLHSARTSYNVFLIPNFQSNVVKHMIKFLFNTSVLTRGFRGLHHPL